MISNDQKLNILDRILSSKSFLSSPTSTALLKFLVEATLNGVDIKESVIGLHIFGRQYQGEKSNARVRVSVYHLRKRLEQYYKNEGVGDVWQLAIDKGQYHVSFPRVPNSAEQPKPKMNLHIIYAAVIALLLAGFALSRIKARVPIWEPLLSNHKKTVFYIGDVYGYTGKTLTGSRGWLRDYRINNEEDLNRIKGELGLTDREIMPASYSYVTASEVDAVKCITAMFSGQGKDFSVRLASKIDVKDLKEQNIIYAGPIKTNNRFIKLLTERQARFTYRDEMLFVADSSGKHRALAERYRKELQATRPSEIAVVCKLTGMHNTQQFLFFSDHDMGVRATVEYFTNTDSLKGFQNAFLRNKDDFTAIFLVNGDERVDLGMKLLDIYGHIH